MKEHYTLSGAQWLMHKFPLYGNAANINAGAIVIAGATSGTNLGFGIVGAAPYTDVLGLTQSQHNSAAAGDDSKQDGTKYSQDTKVICNPDLVLFCELSTPAVAAIAIASVSTVTVTVTGAEASNAGSWLWGSDNQLQYVTGTGSNTWTTKTASGWTAATTLSRLNPLFWTLMDLNTTADKLLPAAAAGTGRIRILESYLSFKGKRDKLDPTKHSGVTYDSTLKIFADIVFLNHAFGNRGAS